MRPGSLIVFVREIVEKGWWEVCYFIALLENHYFVFQGAGSESTFQSPFFE